MTTEFKYGDVIRNKFASMEVYFIGVSVTDPQYGIVEFKNGDVAQWRLDAILPASNDEPDQVTVRKWGSAVEKKSLKK